VAYSDNFWLGGQMSTARFYLYNDTRRIMRERARRVFIRQAIGGFALVLVVAFSVGYFGG